MLNGIHKIRDWTQEEQVKLITMRAEGYPYSHISVILGRTNDACRTKVKSLKKLQQEDLVKFKELCPSVETKIMRPWTREELLTLYEMRRAGIAFSLISIELGRTELSCSSKYSVMHWDSYVQEEDELGLQDKILENRKIAHQERIARAWDRKNQAHKIGLDIICDQLKDFIQVLPPVPPPVLEHKRKTSHKSEDVVIVISDLHVGAEHTLEETGYLSEYNQKILMKRVENLKLAVRDIHNIHSQVYDLPNLHVVCLGDVVAGDNTSGEWSANYINMPVAIQCTTGFRILRDLLNYWLGLFKNVTFYGVRGNHGRIGTKGEEKDYCNWDYVAYDFLQDAYKDNPRLKFVVPKTWWIMEEIKGWNMLMVHGDDVKGKTFPVKNIVDFQRKMTGIIRKIPDYTIAAHFHRSCEISTNEGLVMINGSFVGGDVYSIKTIHSSCKPEQIIFGMSESRGRTWKYNIHLDNDRSPDVLVEEDRGS
jgi:hypothetical protein